MMLLFKDRQDGGRQLAAQLSKYRDQKDVLVLGLARGGVVTAFEVASGLNLPLNVIVVRKIGAPGNEELALGAIAEHGEGIFNEHLIGILGVPSDHLKKEIQRQKKILKERLDLYRGDTPAPVIKGKTVILVDDGIATGASMRVAIKSVRDGEAKKIVLAIPVAAPDSLRKIEKEVDEVVCLSSPAFFEAVGAFYRVFDQTSDEEVIHLLARGR
ncbi:MAG: phosphoribosyltransferase [Rhabdochlamydiaceae bacterium]|jgi:putative phosphoribosyl transferase